MLFVRQSTYDAALKRAKTTGRALSEMTGELIDGMWALGFSPTLKPDETSAGKVIRLLSDALADVNALKIERDTAQRERDEYRTKLQPFLDRRARDKATLAEHNERRHLEALQRAAVRDGTAGIQNAQPKANAAAVQGAVS